MKKGNGYKHYMFLFTVCISHFARSQLKLLQNFDGKPIE